MAPHDRPPAICTGCGKRPAQLESVTAMLRDPDTGAQLYADADAYVWAEEGTLNPANGHFLCDDCYIKAGMPANPAPGPRWVAP